MDKFSYISNADVSSIDALYQSYKQNRESVDYSWQKFFEGFEFYEKNSGAANGNGKAVSTDTSHELTPLSEKLKKEIQVRYLIMAYRSRAHLRSNTNPVRKRKDRKPILDLHHFGLGEEDLKTVFYAGEEIGIGPATLEKILEALKHIYEGTIGFEYMYIRDPERLLWFRNKIEKEYLSFSLTSEEKKRILLKLNEAVVFENFLHTKYVGQKRFSLEGGETTIPALDTIINKAAELGVEEVMIGMAHRGRLNVLANIMKKTYEQIFTEFEGTAIPDLTMGDGDVKYHMGYSSEVTTLSGRKINLKLAPNPSHLEAVDPVVQGFVRAQIDREFKDSAKILPVLIHGDAAIAGQGIVYEVTQMSKLAGYTTGGTIHFVINNQVGFTTDFEDARSSIYCTDVAKTVDCPVLHVNGDDPEAVVFCARLAVEFRQRFQRDIYIDMVCYRRHGHNESDEPKFTQPALYNIIARHPNPREIYLKKLVERGEVDAEIAKQMDKEFRDLLQDRLNQVKEQPLPYTHQKMEKEWMLMRKSKPEDFDKSPETGISEEYVSLIAKALTTIPENFKPIKQIETLLKERKKMFYETKVLNWASAELLAYGSVLLDKKIVRLSGQDVQRGTFSHRHAVLKDAETNEAYNSLNYISPGNQRSFRIFNSLLSEYGVLGFEFGYAMANPNALVIWEAQFGDFANGAQVAIDQFVVSTETKWQRQNGLVMLLPHGYEGQGPEHSSARLERFLELSADYNICVVNITTPSNFFHALRRQLAWPFRKPLIVMSPKSLLRHPLVQSPISEFTSGCFREIIDDDFVDPKEVKKLLLCTGKIYYDLLEEQQKSNRRDVAIVRLEQLYPFPQKQLIKILEKYEGALVRWVQEEPFNMGAWGFILKRMYQLGYDLQVIARDEAASPAVGYYKAHVESQKELVKHAFKDKYDIVLW
ncbi:MAG: 2-oxoglutarate dehydrogenase E1 component [Cytophagaceae bacterium]|nr:2-oxoglutarate dehydrogenase E1 component [Cytophagaceae bacterium]MDW8455785.1 2-oxoglutarate dehydrogenase E1 component [Cytophagaceae bacterium]